MHIYIHTQITHAHINTHKVHTHIYTQSSCSKTHMMKSTQVEFWLPFTEVLLTKSRLGTMVEGVFALAVMATIEWMLNNLPSTPRKHSLIIILLFEREMTCPKPRLCVTVEPDATCLLDIAPFGQHYAAVFMKVHVWAPRSCHTHCVCIQVSLWDADVSASHISGYKMVLRIL